MILEDEVVFTFRCPVCERHIFKEDYDICPVCNWCHDIWQEENPDIKNMDNIMSLNEAKQAFKEGKEIF